MEPKNLGVINPKTKETDYISGAETGIVYQEVNPSGNWLNWLPKKEPQSINGFETSACVSFSALNCIEIQLNHFLNAGKIPADQLKKLTDWGYIEDDKFNFSDRFTAKVSGTTPQGNNMQTVWDSIRKDGLVPESMWKSDEAKNWAEYYNEIPQQVKDFAKNILTILNFKYEWIVIGNACNPSNLDILKYHLKQAPLQPAHPVCARNDQGVIIPCGYCLTQHATTIYNVGEFINDFDHYPPYLNDYVKDYPFPWIMKGIVLFKKDEPVPPVFDHKFETDIKYRDRSVEVLFLQKALNILGYKIPIFPDPLGRGYYGEITKSAVKDFQLKYSVASLPVLIWNNGRFVYEKTRNQLNKLLT